MANVRMGIWGYGSCWNMDILSTKKEVEALQKKIDEGDWDFETYGEADEPCDAGITISPAQGEFFVEDEKGKTVFKSSVDALPYSVFRHSYKVLEEGCCFSWTGGKQKKLKFCGVWLYDETAKGEFASLEDVDLPKSGFDVKKLTIYVLHFIRDNKEIFTAITDVSYDGEDFEMDATTNFKGGGSLTIY